MPLAFIAIGSNLGDRHALLDAAVRRLRAEPGSRLVAVSQWYETAPVDCPPGAGSFLNGALSVETDKTPVETMKWLLKVEESFGRHRSIPHSPRTLDLDLLLYDDRIVHEPPLLLLPHPRMQDRGFVLVPLAEIAGNVVHPTLNASIATLRDRIPTNDIRVAEQPTPPARTLEGTNALVTGSTSGIGACIAESFRIRGATVITHGRRPLPGRHVSADLRKPAEVDRLAEESWGDGLDALVCCAGADILTGHGAKLSFDEKLSELWTVDVASAIRLCRAIGAKMKSRGRGSIITIGWDQSETGMAGDSGQLFGAVKAAVSAFSKSLSVCLAPEVRVNHIAPGWIRTAWGETAPHEWQERVRRETPLGIWGLPEDVAAAALWLTEPSAAWMTGQTIRVNGGAVRS